VAMPATPPKRGYGRQLIERALSYTLGAQSDLLFGADGIICRIEVPLERSQTRLLRAAQ
jgi:two-component system, chemotaxis family, CheB/CheR fusion protein